jgi:hypothetical protein
VLRIEALEARANPTAAGLGDVTTTWTSPTQVVITGTVTDTSAPTTVLVGGAATAAVPTSPTGNFSVALNLNQAGGAVVLAAQPAESNAQAPVTVVADGRPTLSNVTITQEDGVWHIRGQVVGGTPGATIIQIISTIPSVNGTTQVVENPDGSFDIGITLPEGSAGGSISIRAIDQTTGDESDLWSGFID